MFRQPSNRVLSAARIAQVLGDQITEAQVFVELTHQNQATVRCDPRALKIDLQRKIEGKLKRAILPLTHWVLLSKTP